MRAISWLWRIWIGAYGHVVFMLGLAVVLVCWLLVLT